jgi:hypothetical protein
VGVWEISSNTTTVPAARGPLFKSMRSRAIVLASRPAPASSATALAVVATATTGRPSPAAARAAAWSMVVFPKPAGDSTVRKLPPSPATTRTAAT